MLHGDALQSAALVLQGNGLKPDDQEAIDFEAIRRFWRKRRRVCVAWLCLGLLCGAVYATVSPASYTATAAVLLQDPTPRTTGAVAVAQSDAAHSTYIETQVQVFTSNEIIGRVVDTLNLVDDPEFGRNAGGLRTWLMQQVRSLLRSSQAPDRSARYETIVRVRHALAVHRIGTSDVLEIQFTSRDPVRAADFADAVIRSFVDNSLAEQRKERKATAEYTRELLDQLRDKAFPTDPPDETPAIASGPQAHARFLEEQQKTEAYRGLYGRLLQRVLGDPDSELPATGLQVITPPTPPLIAGSRLITVIAFTGLAGVVGMGHALLRELADDTLRTVDDVRRSADIGRVIAIPKLNQSHLDPEQASRAHETDCPLMLDAMGKLAVPLIEAGARQGRHVVGVVSPLDGAGVSLVAGKLAQVIAETGRKTCLVDANWRLPAPDARACGGTQFGKLAGFLETVAGAAGPLDILTLRATAPVSELTASLSVLAALESATAQYEWVVIDFHSLAQSVDFEAAANVFDHVVIVAEAGRTTRQGLREVLNIVSPLKLAAVVLNKAKLGKTERMRRSKVHDERVQKPE